jgi:ATP-dependent Zn protease
MLAGSCFIKTITYGHEQEKFADTKEEIRSVTRRRTNNTMPKRKRTDNTMVKGKRTDNTMAKRKRTNNTMAKRKRTDNTRIFLWYLQTFLMYILMLWVLFILGVSYNISFFYCVKSRLTTGDKYFLRYHVVR